MKRRQAIIAAVAAAALLLLITLFGLLSGVLADYWWFSQLGYESVYTRILFTQVWLWLVGFAVGFCGIASGILIAQSRLGELPTVFRRVGQWTVRATDLRRYVVYALWGTAVLAGLVGGSLLSPLWHRVLLFLNRVPFEVSDPIFGNDVGFYVFTFPLLSFGRQALQVLLWLSLGTSVILYLVSGSLVEEGQMRFPQRGISHVNKMVGLIFVVMAAGYLLDRYGLLYSTEGATFGAGYTDVHARLPAYWIMCVISLGVAGIFFYARAAVRLKPLMIGIGVWLGCTVLFQGAYPAFLQRFRVRPNELQRESPYIKNMIDMTLAAYDLSDVETVRYPVKEDLSYEDINRNEVTIENVRLWDWRPLRDTYRQVQELRPYYDFSDVDIDRYELERGYTETMLAVRELSQDKVAPQAQTWVNLRMKYTHGFGVVMSPVNEHTSEGLPVLIIKDIPAQTPPGLTLQQERIYYGQRTSDYVFVNTGASELDYPKGDENAYFNYDGAGGVPMASAFRKFIYYLQLQDVNILLSDDLVEGSRVMYHRLIRDRIKRIAPYLALDGDPYAVIHEGRIVWVQDAYTKTRLYPYSEPARRGGLNYIRNSVKAVVDAYDGTVSLYVADPDDPLIRTYQKMFPGVYQPLSEMPTGLRRHLRYPVDFFNLQAAKYRTFHMTDPQVFYNKEDVWEVPLERYRGEERPVESYYIVMKLPGSQKAEFMLVLPFTPENKPNMIAWMTARCDPGHYGELMAFRFPKQKLIYGPRQVEARIDQDTEISRQLSLWSQRGSDVIRGNLLVIPVAGGILYVEPLYIEAEEGAVPQLKQVITAYGKRVAMRATLRGSLQALFGVAEAPPPEPPPPAAPEPEGAPVGLREALQQAAEHYDRAQAALKAGEWAEYGRQMDQLKQALNRLAETAPEPAQE